MVRGMAGGGGQKQEAGRGGGAVQGAVVTFHFATDGTHRGYPRALQGLRTGSDAVDHGEWGGHGDVPAHTESPQGLRRGMHESLLGGLVGSFEKGRLESVTWKAASDQVVLT